MNRLDPSGLAAFARRYRFAGGRLKSARLGRREGRVDLDVVLAVRTAIRDLGTDPAPVRLHLRLTDVDEFRIQRRPGSPLKVTDVAFGAFNGQVFVNLDAWGLEPGEKPGVHDFRASDLYAAGRELFWEEKTAGSGQ